MIIGYDFFGFNYDGCVWDTPICTDMLDELRMYEGIYDEAYINLDTTIPNDTSKPEHWSIHTIMDAKFQGDLEAGSLDDDGFKITHIQLYRSIYGTENWGLISEFPFNPKYNIYEYEDRYVQNETVYQYAISPVANEIVGDMVKSDPITVKYDGIFLTDKNENKKLKYDINLGDITYNTTSATKQPINGKYPIVIFGESAYRSGKITVLPLSQSTIDYAGAKIDRLQEQIERMDWLNFLNNRKAKVLRMDSGVIMLVMTSNATVTHKEGALSDLATISFDYVEIGDLTYDMLQKNDLLTSAIMSKYVYDDYGGLVGDGS